MIRLRNILATAVLAVLVAGASPEDASGQCLRVSSGGCPTGFHTAEFDESLILGGFGPIHGFCLICNPISICHSFCQAGEDLEELVEAADVNDAEAVIALALRMPDRVEFAPELGGILIFGCDGESLAAFVPVTTSQVAAVAIGFPQEIVTRFLEGALSASRSVADTE